MIDYFVNVRLVIFLTLNLEQQLYDNNYYLHYLHFIQTVKLKNILPYLDFSYQYYYYLYACLF